MSTNSTSETIQSRTGLDGKNGIIKPLKVDECSEWCNSFVAVRKPSGDVWLCIDPAKLNRAII